MKGICKRARFLEKRLRRICKEDTFLENNLKEFARESSSWRKAGRNFHESRLPGKKTDGISNTA
jgi:hypothetical protein